MDLVQLKNFMVCVKQRMFASFPFLYYIYIHFFNIYYVCTLFLVRLYDIEAKLVIIKTTRDATPILCESIRLLTVVKNNPIKAIVLSIHGSSRTAKIASLKELRRSFNQLYKEQVALVVAKMKKNQKQNMRIRLWKDLMKRIDKIHSLR